MEKDQSSICQLPKRVKGSHTTSFRTIDITTNHFKVHIPTPFQHIYIFSVKFVPQIAFDNRSLRNKILKDCLSVIKTFIRNPVICGMNILSTQAASQVQKDVLSGQYTVKIKQVKTLNVKENPKVCLNFLNNSFRNVMDQLGYIEIGKSGKFFNVNHRKQFDNLFMFSGYKANYCMLENGIYLRVDSAKKIVRNQTVLEFINDIYKIHQDKEREERRKIVQTSLIGLTVMANYAKSRYYYVQDVVFKDIQTTVLEGQSTSIVKYYQEKYNITIKNLKQPLLKVQNKKGKFDILLVPQLCLMTGIPENFDEFRRKKVSENTILDAGQKERQIKDLMKSLKNHQEINSLKEFGIQLSGSMQKLKAKQITIPKITLGKDNQIQDGKEAFFNLFNKPIYASKHSIRCGVLYFDSSDVRGLLDTFDRTASNLGVKFEIEQIKMGDFDNRRAMDLIDKAIKKAVDKYQCNICCIVIPNPLKTQYPRIKKLALIDNNMVCQIVTDATLRKKNLQSIATKVLLQIIAKRGNTLWVPKSKSSFDGIMLAAFDHAKVSGNKFMLALCATINSTFTSIASRSGAYDGNSNKFQLMCNQFLSVIDAYTTRNEVPPKQIILLHNSCSFDQVKLYNQFFITPILKRIQEIYNEKAPSFTMIMVNTKTSQRLFSQYNGRVQNVRAGTLVNTTVVSNDYDFYIVSQNSNKGCSVPNHYKVISSNSKMEQGVLQELVFGQCFNYVNWTGSIKVPGILQYAKKCAKFNSEVLEERQLSQDLMSKLYFV